MLANSLKYFFQHPDRLSTALAVGPVEAWIKFQDRYVERRERQRPIFQYKADAAWEARLHERVGFTQPCGATSDFRALWDSVISSMQSFGLRVGPCGFGDWNDGDAGLTRAIWCLVLHLRPRNVVETGVGRGVTSRFILEALERNGSGELSSIDTPPMDPALRAQVGIAVGEAHRERWSYIEGSSRRRLPALLRNLGQIDLFIHDSLHSGRNVRFELDHAWPRLRPGGAVVVDDIDANDGFHSFVEDFPGHPAFVCEAEPIHEDPRRFNRKGLFGIVLKMPLQN